MGKSKLDCVGGIALAALLLSEALGARPQEEGAGTEIPQVTVTVAGQEYRLLFERSDLPQGVRTAIGKDIGQILSGVDQVTLKDLAGRASPTQKYHVSITHRLDLRKYKHWLPDVLKDCFGGVTRTGGKYCLLVHERVIQRYEKALALREQRAAAFDCVDGFLTRINNKRRRRELARTIADARELFYFHQTAPWDTYETYAENLGLGPTAWMRVHPPSLLDFEISGELGNALVFSTVVRSREKGDVKEGLIKLPFVYARGQWRIVIVAF